VHALVLGLAVWQRVERDVGEHDSRRVSLFEKHQENNMHLQSVLLGLGELGCAARPLARNSWINCSAEAVVSLWSVNGSTAALMQQMCRYLVQGLPQALRLAMLRLARRPAPENALQSEEPSADGLCVEWKRPMHWAGFLVSGRQHTPLLGWTDRRTALGCGHT